MDKVALVTPALCLTLGEHEYNVLPKCAKKVLQVKQPWHWTFVADGPMEIRRSL